MGKRLTRAEYHNNVCRNGCVCGNWGSIKRRICDRCDNEQYLSVGFEDTQDRVCRDCKNK